MTWSNLSGWLLALCFLSLSVFYSYRHTHTFTNAFSVSAGSPSSLNSCFSLSLTSVDGHPLFHPQQCKTVFLSLFLAVSLTHIHTSTHSHNGVHFTAHCRHYLPFLQMAIIMETEMSICWNHSLSNQISLPSACVLVCVWVCVCYVSLCVCKKEVLCASISPAGCSCWLTSNGML